MKLGLKSGVGLGVATMVGSGVFLSAGFMAQEMGPTWIMMAWVIGILHALCGAMTYGEAARLIPKSGGEYRFLSELVHPLLGFIAGFATLILGFAAPVAVNALAASEFAGTLVQGAASPWVATGLVIAVSLLHLSPPKGSLWSQNILAGCKILFLVGFVVVGLVFGTHESPSWVPPAPKNQSLWLSVAASMFYIQFAFSGWNTSAYNAEAFVRPEKTVPKVMLIAALSVGVYYLIVNWIFVANLNPGESINDSEAATMAHLLIAKLLGPQFGALMSVLTIVILISAMSAMIMVAPHVTSSMANDGFLPRSLMTSKRGPSWQAQVIQISIALLIVWAHSLRDALTTVGAIILCFSTLVAFAIAFNTRHTITPVKRLFAMLYALPGCYFIFVGFKDRPEALLWLALPTACATLFYLFRPNKSI